MYLADRTISWPALDDAAAASSSVKSPHRLAAAPSTPAQRKSRRVGMGKLLVITNQTSLPPRMTRQTTPTKNPDSFVRVGYPLLNQSFFSYRRSLLSGRHEVRG